MIPNTYELKNCLLKDSDGQTLFMFDARAVEERNKSASFVGSGLASDSHSFRIATAKIFNYEPFNHSVVIDEVNYIITARQPLTQKKVGERFRKNISEMLLSLG